MEMKRSTYKSSTSLIRGGRFSFIGLCMQQGIFLTQFFYDKPEIEHDAAIMSDLYKCILMLTRNPAKQEKVVAKVSLYTNAQGLFRNELDVKTMKVKTPGQLFSFVYLNDQIVFFLKQVNCFTKLLTSILQLNGGLHMELQLQICKGLQ